MPLTMDDDETWKIVMSVGVKYEVDPGMNPAFFNTLLARYSGEFSKLEAWIDEQIADQFQVMDEYPTWIQNPAWPYDDEG